MRTNFHNLNLQKSIGIIGMFLSLARRGRSRVLPSLSSRMKRPPVNLQVKPMYWQNEMSGEYEILAKIHILIVLFNIVSANSRDSSETKMFSIA